MLKIGITGGIGSGKTTVCKLFELQHIPVFYADLEARHLMLHDQDLMAQIRQAFGHDIYLPDGSLDRSRLAAIVFNDESRLGILNSLVHPAVFKAFRHWVAQQKAPYVIKEAALLFESGSDKDCDITVLVKSPHHLKMSRILKRDRISDDEIRKRMSRQLSDDEKEKLADFVINNDEQELLIPRVLGLHQRFLLQQAGSE